ncbi:MAG: tetratricopeptide repeat protein [Fuerstiella sp.]
MSTKSRRFEWPTKTAFASAVLAISCVAGCNQQDQQAESLVRKALQQQEAGNTEDAVKSLNRSIKLDADLAEAYYLRGSCHAALGNQAEALRDLKKTSVLRSDWDRSWWALGTLHRSMDQNDDAVTCLTTSVRLNPKALDARYDLACLLIKLGNKNEAMIHLVECRKQDPDGVKSLIKLAALEMEGDPQAATKTLSHVLTLDRSNAFVWTQRALAQELSADIPRALADFTVACRLQPKSSQAWFHRGRLLTKLERHEEAIDCLKIATELAPDDFDIKRQLLAVREMFDAKQAAMKNQLVEALPAEPSSAVATDSEPVAAEFAMFPADLGADSQQDPNGVDTAKRPQEASTDFAVFPGFEEVSEPVIAEAEAPAVEESPSFDFPAFGELSSDTTETSEAVTALIPETEQPFDGLQIPTNTLEKIESPQPDPASIAAADETSPFTEFMSDPVEAIEAIEVVAEEDQAPIFADLVDDAAVVVIEELNTDEPAAQQYTVNQLDAMYQQALAAYRNNDVSGAESKLSTLLQHDPAHKNARLRLASILEEKGQLAEALEHCDQLLNDHGLSEAGVLLKAQVQKRMGQSEDAVDTYTTLIASKTPSAKVLSERADLLLELKQYDAAIQDLTALVDGKVMLPSSLARRAAAFESQQQWGLAIADWTNVGRLDGSNLNALEHRADAFAQMGETAPAIADLQNLLRLQPQRLDVVEKLCDLNASIGRWDRVYNLTSQAVQSEDESDELLFLKATAASQLGKTDEAIAALTDALKENPKHQPARVRRAELQLKQQNFEASLADWNQAIEMHGESANLLAGRASALAAMGKRDQAVADLDQAISIEPNHISARRKRSQLFQGMGDHKAAISDAGELLLLQPAEPQGLAIRATSLFEQQKFKEAADAFEQAISSDPTNTDFIWKRAQCRLQLSQNELAVQDLDQLLQRDPTHKGGLKERAKLKEEVGSYTSAVADLDTLLQLDPRDSDALLNRGILHHRMAKFEAAVADLSDALELQPSLHSAYYRRGLALHQLNKPGAALADLEAAIEADSNNADYLYSRGNLFASQSINGRAIEDYAQAVAIRPSHAAAWYNYGNMLFPAGNVGQAVDCWNKAIEIQPDLFRAYNNRAAARVQLKEYQKAIEDYKRTLDLNPSYAHAYDNYAWLLATADDAAVRNPQKAIELASKACQLTNNKDWAYLSTLAAAYAETGDFDSARKWLMKSHELAPGTQKDRLVRLVKTYESEMQRGSARKAEKRAGSSIRL